MIYLLAALVIAVLILFFFCLKYKKDNEILSDLYKEEILKNANLQVMLERTKQREEIDYSNMGLTDAELDERLQNDYRD